MSDLFNPYERFASTELILRDQLAIDRTVLANERTFLSYIRTALAFALTGAGSMRFFDSLVIHAVGGLLIVAGLVIAIIGIRRTMIVSRNLGTVSKNPRTAVLAGDGMGDSKADSRL